jgi:hypothetical protein
VQSDAKHVANALPMTMDGPVTDSEQGGNLLGGITGGEQAQNFQLSPCQSPWGCLQSGTRWNDNRNFAFSQSCNCIDKVSMRSALYHDPRRSDSDQGIGDPVVRIQAHDEYAKIRIARADVSDQLQGILVRQREWEDYHVWLPSTNCVKDA